MRFSGDKPQGRIKGHPPLAGMRQNGFDWVSYLWVSGPEWFSSWGWVTCIEIWGNPAATFRLSRYRLGSPLSPESAGDFNQKDNKDKNMNKMYPKPCVHETKQLFFQVKTLIDGCGVLSNRRSSSKVNICLRNLRQKTNLAYGTNNFYLPHLAYGKSHYCHTPGYQW